MGGCQSAPVTAYDTAVRLCVPLSHSQHTVVLTHPFTLTVSDVETNGSGGSMNRGPELLGAPPPESGAEKYATSEKLTSK